MATLADIAKEANVHITTVSKALNDSTDISDETKKRIKSIADRLNYSYKSKHAAGSKAISKANTIGVICPEIKSNYYAQILSTIESKSRDKGYGLIIGFTNFQYENELHYLKLFAKKNIDGIICITEGTDIKKDLKALKEKSNIPTILVATEVKVQECDSIKVDDYLGVSMAMEHLIGLGHRDICYIGDLLSQGRLNTYLEVLEKHGIEIDEDLIKVNDERFEPCGYEGMKEILDNKKLPTAVFAAYDAIAIGAMRAIYERGLSIPEEISVISIDDIETAPYLYRGLTTVSGPISEMANIATKLLFKKVENKDYKVVQHINLQPELIIRESTAKPRTNDR